MTVRCTSNFFNPSTDSKAASAAAGYSSTSSATGAIRTGITSITWITSVAPYTLVTCTAWITRVTWITRIARYSTVTTCSWVTWVPWIASGATWPTTTAGTRVPRTTCATFNGNVHSTDTKWYLDSRCGTPRYRNSTCPSQRAIIS